MIGSEHDKADDAERANRYLADAVVYRFLSGQRVEQIAKVYGMPSVDVEALIREHVYHPGRP